MNPIRFGASANAQTLAQQAMAASTNRNNDLTNYPSSDYAVNASTTVRNLAQAAVALNSLDKTM